MIADPDGVLARAVGAPGAAVPRFYPAGAHPAAHQLRLQLFALERHREKAEDAGLDLTPADEAIAEVRRQIRAHEVGEDIAKCRYLLAHYEFGQGSL